MNQEQLVYLKRYFHKASPSWSSHSREMPETIMKTDTVDSFKGTKARKKPS